MPLVNADRVRETSTTSGTGTLTLAGAPTGYRTFAAGVGNNNTCHYCIVDPSAGTWEVGIGTVTDSTTDTLSRTTVLASSNAGALVSFSANTKDVFCTYPASKAVTTQVLEQKVQVCVLDYGADPTGATDCTTAITNAIAAAKAATGSGIVFFPKGKYLVSTGAISLENISLRGCGIYEGGDGATALDDNGSVILLTNTGASSYPFTLGSSVNIEGLTFFYPNNVTATANPVVYPALFNGTRSVRVLINNCTIVNAYVGFRFDTTGAANIVGDFRVTNCRACFLNTGFLFSAGAPEAVYLSDNLFSYGVFERYVWPSGVATVMSNYICKNASLIDINCGSHAWTSVDGLTTSGNMIYGYRYGIRVLSGSLNVSTIVNNKFDAVATALQVEGAGKAQGTMLIGNLFDSFIQECTVGTSTRVATNTQPTIFITGTGATTTLSITGNTFTQSQGAAIAIGGTTIDEITITGNKFKSWGQTSTGSSAVDYPCIQIGESGGFGVISGNQFKANKTYTATVSGIYLGNVTSMLVEGNHFDSCYIPVRCAGTASLGYGVYNNTSLNSTHASNSFIADVTTAGNTECFGNRWDINKPPNRYAYPVFRSKYNGSSQTFNSGTATDVAAAYNGEVFDEDNNYDVTTGVFTAPTAGIYAFEVSLAHTSGVTINDVWYLRMVSSGGDQCAVAYTALAQQVQTVRLSGQFKLTAGQTVKCQVYRSAGSGSFVVANDGDLTFFTGRKVV